MTDNLTDNELVAMDEIVKYFTMINAEARKRVLMWAWARYVTEGHEPRPMEPISVKELRRPTRVIETKP